MWYAKPGPSRVITTVVVAGLFMGSAPEVPVDIRVIATETSFSRESTVSCEGVHLMNFSQNYICAQHRIDTNTHTHMDCAVGTTDRFLSSMSPFMCVETVSYTHLTLPTTPYV